MRFLIIQKRRGSFGASYDFTNRRFQFSVFDRQYIQEYIMRLENEVMLQKSRKADPLEHIPVRLCSFIVKSMR